MTEKSMLEILNAAIDKFNRVINTAEIGLLPNELSNFDEAMLHLGDLHKRLKMVESMIGGESND